MGLKSIGNRTDPLDLSFAIKDGHGIPQIGELEQADGLHSPLLVFLDGLTAVQKVRVQGYFKINPILWILR